MLNLNDIESYMDKLLALINGKQGKTYLRQRWIPRKLRKPPKSRVQVTTSHLIVVAAELLVVVVDLHPGPPPRTAGGHLLASKS